MKVVDAVSADRMPEDRRIILWSAVAACGFFEMDSSYLQPDFHRRYAIPEELSVAAGQQIKKVAVSPRAFMGRFSYLERLFAE